MTEVYKLYISRNLTQKEIAVLSQYISVEKQQKLRRLSSLRDKQNTLLADLLIRLEIGRRTGLKNYELVFSSNSYQKPYCRNAPEIQYNISHSGCYVVCAISDKSVGIDIETVKKTNLKLIAQRFFAPDEYKYVSSTSAETQTYLIYEIWTKKEAYIKYQGKGLAIPLTSFSVINRPDVYFHNIPVDKEVIGHVCSEEAGKIDCQIVDAEQLISYYISH